ncbi:MAG TPA: efflux RND transporter periplasmic adaptor subunit [Bryobacteraceae bacterium]|nr:efflux RND transporter periplasmic adaptor subunit [Bryobacteraceae bacterium]
MKIRTALFWMALGSALTASALFMSERKISASTNTRQPDAPAVTEPRIAAASPGRVEGASEPVEVGAAADGVIQSVLVKEGQFVAKGSVMAQIACMDVEAELKQATAEQEAAQQRLSRVLAGSRPEERQLVAQKVKTAEAILDEASRYFDRMKVLAAKDDIPQAALDKARRDFEVARSQVEEALRNQRLIDAPPMKQDTQRAQAELDAAAAQVLVAEETFAKCTVRAPISGTVTRSFAKPGESFSTLMPRPLFTISDVSARRVRAQVDERDIALVKPGQVVEISADAFPNRTFKGTVVQVYPALGRKTVLTGDPAEKTDRDVLETLIRLQPDANVLPLGLRVAVQFIQGEAGSSFKNPR